MEHLFPVLLALASPPAHAAPGPGPSFSVTTALGVVHAWGGGGELSGLRGDEGSVLPFAATLPMTTYAQSYLGVSVRDRYVFAALRGGMPTSTLSSGVSEVARAEGEAWTITASSLTPFDLTAGVRLPARFLSPYLGLQAQGIWATVHLEDEEGGHHVFDGWSGFGAGLRGGVRLTGGDGGIVVALEGGVAPLGSLRAWDAGLTLGGELPFDELKGGLAEN